MKDENFFMQAALELAREAAKHGEVPVGAIVVKDGEIISRGQNRREKGGNALYHAEIEAIDKACKKIGSWRLWQCELYVTLEPCPMCSGAIINSRLKRVIYGASDPKGGCFGSVINFNNLSFNHKPEVVSGILADESAKLLSDFFKELRLDKTKSSWKNKQGS